MLTLDPRLLYKGLDSVKPGRAHKITVSSSGKVQYHYYRVGGEAPNTPRLRELNRPSKKKDKQERKAMETLKRSDSEWDDLLKGGATPDSDDGSMGGGGGWLEGGLLIAGLCFISYLPLLLLLNGILQAYIKSAWTLTYLRLTSKRQAEEVEVQALPEDL